MVNQYYVYLHCRPTGDPFYVGKGCSLHHRSHDLKRDRNKYHRNIVLKYGQENIEVLVFPRDCEASALADEVLWIRELRQAGYVLTNMTDGGEGLSNPSIETREKLSKSKMGNKLCIGRCLSAETKEKIAATKRGRTHSADTRLKMSLAGRGRPSRLRGRKRPSSVGAKISATKLARKLLEVI